MHAFLPAVFLPGHSDRFTMKDDKDKDEGHAANPAKKHSRQDRLKLALRENLKRRKSQARGRGDVAMAPSNRDDITPHDERDKKPDE
jgi:hypothetical protein